MEFRVQHNSKEKIAQQIVGTDTDASHFVMNEERADKLFAKEKAERFNQQVGDLQERFQNYIDSIQEAGQKLAMDLNHIELMPLTSYVIIAPFKVNPFQQIKMSGKSNLITDLGGLAPQYKNQENGQFEEEQQYVKVGMVYETGTECKFLQPGDIVIYNVNSEITIPFYKFGFVSVAEQRIIAVVNEGLTQRKQDILAKINTDK